MKVVFNIYFPGVNVGIFILLFPLPYYIFFEVNNYMGLTCIWVFAKWGGCLLNSVEWMANV